MKCISYAVLCLHTKQPSRATWRSLCRLHNSTNSRRIGSRTYLLACSLRLATTATVPTCQLYGFIGTGLDLTLNFRRFGQTRHDISEFPRTSRLARGEGLKA